MIRDDKYAVIWYILSYMERFIETYKKTGDLHHAYAFQGEKALILPKLLDFLTKAVGLAIKNNPDFSYQEYETFTIDDARGLQERHGRRAIAGKKIFIISTRFITSEAQNALLKIFEEPSQGTHFFLIMPNTEVLIPTLRSRLVLIDSSDTGSNSDQQTFVLKFLNANSAERLILLKKMIEEKDKGQAIDFVTALEQALAPRLKKIAKAELAEEAEALTEVLLVKKYLHDRAPSIKLLLEHLCLSVTMSKS